MKGIPKPICEECKNTLCQCRACMGDVTKHGCSVKDCKYDHSDPTCVGRQAE